MNIWTLENWKSIYDENKSIRHGIRLKFDIDVDLELKKELKDFCKWMRKQYYFPIRVPVYVKATKRIRAKDGEMVCGTFFEPYCRHYEPYIKIATGDYNELLKKWGRESALANILICFIHELTHYFQWINNLRLTDIGRERQATRYAQFILNEYIETRACF